MTRSRKDDKVEDTEKEQEEIVRELTSTRLEAFVRVSKHGGLAGAAGERNPEAQSRLSRLVTQLESGVNMELFERRDGREGRKIRDWNRLTPAGRRLLDIAEQFLDFQKDSEELRTRAENLPELSLRANDSVLRWFVLPGLSQFGSDEMNAGDLKFRLKVESSTDPFDDVVQGRCELGVGLIPDGLGSDVDSKQLMVWTIVPFIPGGSRVEDNREAVKAQTWVDVTTLPTSPLDALERVLGAGSIKRARVSCETYAHAVHLVRGGRFAAVLPLAAKEELGTRALAVRGVLPQPDPLPRLHLFVRQGAPSRRTVVGQAYESLGELLMKHASNQTPAPSILGRVGATPLPPRQ